MFHEDFTVRIKNGKCHIVKSARWMTGVPVFEDFRVIDNLSLCGQAMMGKPDAEPGNGDPFCKRCAILAQEMGWI